MTGLLSPFSPLINASLKWIISLLHSSKLQDEFEEMSLKQCCSCAGPTGFLDGHDSCVLCLGHAHAETVMMSGFPYCEEIKLKTLCLRIAIVLGNTTPVYMLPRFAVVKPWRKKQQRQPEAAHSGDELMPAQIQVKSVTIICIVLLTMQIVSKQLYISFTVFRRGNSVSK